MRSEDERFPDFARAEHEGHAVIMSCGLSQKVPCVGEPWRQMLEDPRGDYWICVTCGIVRIGAQAAVWAVLDMLRHGRIKSDLERQAEATGDVGMLLRASDELRGVVRTAAEYAADAANLRVGVPV